MKKSGVSDLYCKIEKALPKNSIKLIMKIGPIIFLLLLSAAIAAFAQPDVWLDKGREAMSLRDYDKAIEYFTKAIDHKPQYDDAYFSRGMAKMYAQNYEDALDDFNKAIRINPDKSDHYNARGLCYGYLEDVNKAIADFDKAIQLDPNFAEAYLNRASAYSSIRTFPKARKDLEKAAKLNPNNPEIYFQKGRMNYKLDLYNEAVRDFSKALELGLKHEKVYYNRANAYFKMKDYGKAVKDYTSTLKLDPKDDEARNNRAVAYDRLGMKDKAQKDRDKLNEMAGNIFTPVDQLTFVEYSDSKGLIKIKLPKNWHIIRKNDEFTHEFIVSFEKLQNYNQPYTAGVRFAYNKNMKRYVPNMKSPKDLLDFWIGSQLKNAEDYVTYDIYKKKHFQKNGYMCQLNEVMIQINKDQNPLKLYELAMARGETLVYAYFQSFANQWGHYEKIFDKAIESLYVK